MTSTGQFQDVHNSVDINSSTDLQTKLRSLKQLISTSATIDTPTDVAFHENGARWSEHKAPCPGAVVNVATETDIASTVKWATSNGVKFFAQSGGHGAASGLSTIRGDGIIINLRALNSVSVNLSSGTATFGAGALTKEGLDAAHAAKAHIVTGVCDTVGFIGATLGGCVGHTISLYGLGVDNMVSARLVLASGEIIIVSSTQNPDLWWGLRGAGHNFGIVSELTVKSYPQVNEGIHWTGALGYPGTEENVGRVVKALTETHIGRGMGCILLFARIPPTGFQPMVIANLFYAGAEADAKKQFSKFFELGPVMNMCTPTPYNEINRPSREVCVKGGRKPTFSVSLEKLDLEKTKEIWNLWVAFTAKYDDSKRSIVLVENYGYEKTREVAGEETAFPHRDCNHHFVGIPHYEDPGLDEAAEEYGKKFREILHGEKKKVYVNFATGDEEPEVVYGGQERLKKLTALKEKWDPEGWFSRYSPIISGVGRS